MSVTEPKLTESGEFITVSCLPDDKAMLSKLARLNGSLGMSAMVRLLIWQEARRQGVTLDRVSEPA